jgi:hypothetical protein
MAGVHLKPQKYFNEALSLIDELLYYSRINEAIDAARGKGIKLSADAIRYLNSLYPIEDPKYALRSLFINHMLIRWGFIKPLPYQENVIRIWTNRMDWAGAISGTGDVLISQLPEPGTEAWTMYANTIREQAKSVCTIEYYYQAIAILDTMIKVINTNILRINYFEAFLKPSERRKLMAYVGSPGYNDYRGVIMSAIDFDEDSEIALMLKERVNSTDESFNDRVYVGDYIGAVNALGQAVAGQVEPLMLGYFNHFINDVYVNDGIVTGYKKPERQPLCTQELRSRSFPHPRAAVVVGAENSWVKTQRSRAEKENRERVVTLAQKEENVQKIQNLFPNLSKTKKNFGKPIRQNFGRKNLLEPNTPKHKNAFSEPGATANNLNEALSNFYNATERTRAAVNTTRNTNAALRNQRKRRRTRKRTN